ncbi:MAG: DUF1858 domain-containing protein [Clostridia bacterium]|nr:DUF1858 domain-containing protein [Clostridia bacterium]
MKVNKDMTMGEVIAANPQARLVLEGFGMHCCGCPVSQAEPLVDACDVHGIDVNLVLKELSSLPEPCACGPDCACTPVCECKPTKPASKKKK